MEADGKRCELSSIPSYFISQKSSENLFLSFIKKLLLFVENVSWHLNLKADMEFFTITGKSNTGFRRYKNRIHALLPIYSSQGSFTPVGLTHCMLLNIFIFTDKYKLRTYWSCPPDQELSLRIKGHLPKFTQEYSDGAISDNPLTSLLLLPVPS